LSLICSYVSVFGFCLLLYARKLPPMSMFTRRSMALPQFGTRQSGVFPIARFVAKVYIVLTFEMIMVFKRNDSWNCRQTASIMVCPALSSGLAISEGANR
jgi:hypothetical protein